MPSTGSSATTWPASSNRVRDLAERYGEGPALRRERKRLQGGALPDRNDPSWRLPEEARRDGDALAKQERLREDYLARREQRARQLAKAQGILGRLRNRPEAFLEEVDRRSLRLCPSCQEVAYPRLGVRPARLVRRSGEQDDQLHGALRVLYRDYLAGGGLDCLRASRCHPRPPKPGTPRRPR